MANQVFNKNIKFVLQKKQLAEGVEVAPGGVYTFTALINEVDRNGFPPIDIDGVRIDEANNSTGNLYWSHDSSRPALGNVRFYKDGGRLYAEARFDDDDEFAQVVKNKLDNGIIDGFSIGFDWNKEDEVRDADNILVALRGIDVIEGSIVNRPAHRGTVLERVEKSDKPGKRYAVKSYMAKSDETVEVDNSEDVEAPVEEPVEGAPVVDETPVAEEPVVEEKKSDEVSELKSSIDSLETKVNALTEMVESLSEKQETALAEVKSSIDTERSARKSDVEVMNQAIVKANGVKKEMTKEEVIKQYKLIKIESNLDA